MSVAMAAKMVLSWAVLGWLWKFPGEAIWERVLPEVIAGLSSGPVGGVVAVTARG